MKKNFLAIATIVVAGALTLTSCKKEKGCMDTSILVTNYNPDAEEDDGSCIYRYKLQAGEQLVTSNITSNTTWTADKVWILPNRISVEEGATLTIEAGTVIKGVPGTAANASALLIAQGAKIMAEGTSSAPIIFTSTDDEITSGEIASPNLEVTEFGKWGGLIVLGKAPISADNSPAQIEGIPASDENGLYGGSDAADNSGVIKYVSVRHGGANIGEGNEINGITFGGVGSGTKVENIEVVGNQDDGIEFFGGSVNVTNVIVMNVGDDAIDGDQAYSGTITNVAVICGDETDHAFEIDGAEGSSVGTMTVEGGVVVGSAAAELGQFRDSAMINLNNITFLGFTSQADGRGDLSFDGSGSELNFAENRTTFTGLEYYFTTETWTLTDIFKGGIPATEATDLSGVATGAAAFGATWSWAGATLASKIQ